MTTQQLREEIRKLDKLRQTHQIDNPEYFDAIMTKIQEYVDGVIGEDIDPTYAPYEYTTSLSINKFIAEQRKRGGL